MNKLSAICIGLAVLATVAFVGCGGDSAPPAPLTNFQPEIINSPDNFQFQATAVENVTATVSYNWSNSGQQATINHSSVVDSGTAVVTLYDAQNQQVYTSGLVASANEPTAVGTSGVWRVVVTLTNVYGTLNFRAQML